MKSLVNTFGGAVTHLEKTFETDRRHAGHDHFRICTKKIS